MCRRFAPSPSSAPPCSRRPVSPAPAQASLPGPTFSPFGCPTARSSRSAIVGDRPLKISFGQAPLVAPGFEAVGADWPFAALDRISAEMDREAQALLNETARLQRSALFPGARGLTDSGRLAPGARSVSVVSTLSGGHMCSRSVEVFPSPDGGRPRIVTRTSGDCGPGHPRLAVPGPAATRRARPDEARPDRGQLDAWPDPRARGRERPYRGQVRA